MLLAWKLDTIDVLLQGCLDVGFDAAGRQTSSTVGVPIGRQGPARGRSTASHRSDLARNPVEFEGRYLRVPESFFDLKPVELKLIVTANVEFRPAPLSNDRPIFVGSAEQLEEDISTARRLGVDELIVNALFSPDVDSMDDLLSHTEQLRKMAR